MRVAEGLQQAGDRKAGQKAGLAVPGAGQAEARGAWFSALCDGCVLCPHRRGPGPVSRNPGEGWRRHGLGQRQERRAWWVPGLRRTWRAKALGPSFPLRQVPEAGETSA